MVGQSSNTLTYHGQYNLLDILMDFSNEAKEALRKKKHLLQKHDGNLLGKKFRNHVVEVTKTRKATIEAYSAGKSKSGSSKSEPFPGAKRESCGASYSPHQSLQLSKQQTKMVAAKPQFE